MEHHTGHPTERCNNLLSMKSNLRLRGAQNVKLKRSKRKRHVVENTFRRTQDTAPKRDSKRERINLVPERKTPKRERKTPKRRFKATKIYTYAYIYIYIYMHFYDNFISTGPKSMSTLMSCKIQESARQDISSGSFILCIPE